MRVGSSLVGSRRVSKTGWCLERSAAVARSWTAAVFALATLVLSLGCGDKLTSTARSVAPFRSLVYSEAFGQRFKLAAAGVHRLSPGLQAMAIRVVGDANRQACILNLFMDSSLRLSLSEGNLGIYRSVDDALFFVRELSASDANFIADTSSTQTDDACFRSKPRSDGGRVTECGAPERVMAGLFPGLDLVSVGVACGYLDTRHGPTEVLLKQAAQVDKTPIDSDDPEGWARFDVPPALLSHAQEATQNAARAARTAHGEPPIDNYTLPAATQ
jgi:hypothetical protein